MSLLYAPAAYDSGIENLRRSRFYTFVSDHSVSHGGSRTETVDRNSIVSIRKHSNKYVKNVLCRRTQRPYNLMRTVAGYIRKNT